MKLYQFALPFTPYGNRPHLEFQRWLLATFGGYTNWMADGGWRDLGMDYRETVIVYQIAAEDPPSLETAFALFPDEKAIFLAEIGSAEIVNRN